MMNKDVYNSIFGKIGRIASEEVILQVATHPRKMYVNTTVWSLNLSSQKSDCRPLDFIIDRFFMKLFRTTNMHTIRLC